jgi:hypothetical protein
MTKEATLTIEKAPVDIDGKLEQRKTLAANLEKKLNDFRAELETKSYLVEGQLVTAKALHKFITEDAKWNFSESMGIIETRKQLDEIIKDLETGKRKEIMLSTLALEAIYYFLSKETGVGLSSALYYFNTILKPVTDALSRAKQDKEKKDQLERDLGQVQNAIDQGAVSEYEDQLIAEIAAETEAQ